MFMTKLFSILIVLLSTAYAQIDIAQDRPNISWKKIENRDFRIVFPDYAEGSANYVLNLLNYYKPIVDQTYKQHSRKLTVVIRANVAEPNGFVTLAPRRSEWFLTRSSTPLIGSLEWLQALAIHEYRHVTQFDYFNRSNNRLGWFIGGEETLGTLLAISVPSWFFEGDAVWAETKYSDAGRGRSPRFSSRMKALLLTDQIPSLDQILAGDFTKPLPNIYVFGYFLVAKGVNDYGEDFWKQVAARTSDASFNPYAIYHAFKEITGKGFETFYNEMIEDLRLRWGKDYTLPKSNKEYTAYAYPIEDGNNLYYLKKDVKNFWRLFKKDSNSQKEIEIAELATTPDLHRVDISKGKMLYIQNLPHKRYAYESYSDLFELDLNTGEQRRLTENKKVTHPKYSINGKQYLVIERTLDNQWNINLYNSSDTNYKTFKGAPGTQYIEAVWGDKDDIFAIALDELGKKRIVRIDYYLNKNEVIDLTYPTRNNLYSLSFSDDRLYFEADDKGVVNIFSLNTKTLSTGRCSNEPVEASHPFAINDRLFYVSTNGHGSTVEEKDLNCEPISDKYIEKPKSYLGDGASDNYLKSTPVELADFKIFEKEDFTASSYSEYKSSLIPHSWSVLGGRGLQVSARSTNILNSLDVFGAVGRDPEEEANYGALTASYRKYYPILNVGLRLSERQNIVDEDSDEDPIRWTENAYSAGISLPYIVQKNLYQGYHLLSGFGEYITIGDSQGEVEDNLDNENFLGKGLIYQFSFKKSQLQTHLAPRWGMDATLFYEDVDATNVETLDSYLGTADFNFYLPGFGSLHSIHLGASGEYRPESELKYKVQDKYFPIIGYNFSRGYAYEYTPRFHKLEFEYELPLFYPNFDLLHFAFFKRISGRYFFDHTQVVLDENEIALNSTGIELEFDTFVFRKFPLTLGVRFAEKLRDNEQIAEIFIGI